MTFVGRLTSNTRRFEEVVRIVGKYGLADRFGDNLPSFIRRHLSDPDGKQLVGLTQARRIRLALEELGTTFIKLGQILSTRGDLVGPELAAELSRLQDSAPADGPSEVRNTLANEFGMPLDEVFREFDETPMASASIGQVHRARLADGGEVAVKIQRHGIEERVKNDLDILMRLAEVVERHNAELRRYRVKDIAAQFQRQLSRELDYGREAENLDRFRRNFSNDPKVTFPRPFPEFSTHRVLTMEFIAGTSVRELVDRGAAEFELEDLARRGAQAYLDMIFRDGFYHADPHPGNIFLQPDGTICLLDAGMIGRLNEGFREQVEDLLIGAFQSDPDLTTDALLSLCGRPTGIDRDPVEGDVEEFLAIYSDLPLDQWDFARVITDLMSLVRRHRLRLPPAAIVLLRMLVVLEGTAHLLSPGFSLGEILEPYARTVVSRRLAPDRLWRRMRRSYRAWDQLLALLPQELLELTTRIRRGTLDVHLQHRRLEGTANRLIYGVLVGALVLGASLLLSSGAPPTVGGYSLPGLGFALAAIALGARLLRAIERFGRLGAADTDARGG